MAKTTPHGKRLARETRLKTAAALTVATFTVPLHASSRYYVGPDNGAWNSPLNWSATQDGPGDAGVPATGDTAFVLSPATNLTFDADYTSPISSLVVDATASAANAPTLTQSAHTLSATNEFVGQFNSGTYAQAGGANTAEYVFLGFSAAAHGTYYVVYANFVGSAAGVRRCEVWHPNRRWPWTARGRGSTSSSSSRRSAGVWRTWCATGRGPRPRRLRTRGCC